jgi:phospholipid-binding lipoprotein MlaA
VKAAAILGRLSSLALAATLAACASGGASLPEPQYLAATPKAEAAPSGTPGDPLEKSNRAMFEANQSLNHSIIYPIAEAYQGIPEPVRDSIDSFTTNLSEPLVFANDVLQLRFNAAGKTFTRFLVNSTVGLGGLFDVAAMQGLTKQSGDFGQTMYVWGMRDSPYVVLPIIGPSNVRDTVGNVVELVVPSYGVGLLPARIATTITNVSNVGSITSPFSGINKIGQLKDLEENSLDFYTMMKSVVEQKREADLKEALDTSALTTPFNQLPGADVEPIMQFGPPPSFDDMMTFRKKKPMAVAVEASAPDAAPAAAQVPPETTAGKTKVIVGVPRVE